MNTMVRAGAAMKASTQRRTRCGRPPAERAGEVEERILDAAHKVFLERGFEGASIDQIAETARSGKPTIYSRFPNKEALFAAMVTHRIALKNARVRSHKPSGANIEERLASIALAVLSETLTEEFVGLLRVAISEGHRAPELARSLMAMARQRGGETVAHMLAEVTTCGVFGELRQEREDRFAAAARYFLDLILLPMLMRALSGMELDSLRAEFDSHIAHRVAFFLAACRHGGIV